MKPGIRISEGADLRGLATAVIFEAVRDVTGKRKPFEKRLSALLWLTGPDFEIWSDWAGATLDPYKLLPALREAKTKLQRRSK
jgi:hypothetical protein